MDNRSTGGGATIKTRATVNRHARTFRASPEQVGHWIEACWSGTEDDSFPRDVIRTWRKNPAGVAPLALVPTLTKIGHGFFGFRFESWDGRRFRVRVDQDGFRGWHGFEVVATETGSRVTHTLEVELRGPASVIWPLLIAPIHDWCVEALFDRMGAALETGHVPARTARRMPLRVALGLRLLRAVPPVTRPRADFDRPSGSLRDVFLSRYLER